MRNIATFLIVLSVLGGPLWKFLGDPKEWVRYGEPINGWQQLEVRIDEARGTRGRDVQIVFLGASDVASFVQVARREAINARELETINFRFLPEYNPETDATPLIDFPSGRDTQFSLDRLDAWLGDESPDIAVVGFGYWDADSAVEVEVFVRNLMELVRRLQARGIKVVLMTSTPFGPAIPPDIREKNNQRIEEYNARIRGLCAESEQEGDRIVLFDREAETLRLEEEGVDTRMDLLGTHHEKAAPYRALTYRLVERLAEAGFLAPLANS